MASQLTPSRAGHRASPGRARRAQVRCQGRRQGDNGDSHGRRSNPGGAQAGWLGATRPARNQPALPVRPLLLQVAKTPKAKAAAKTPKAKTPLSAGKPKSATKASTGKKAAAAAVAGPKKAAVAKKAVAAKKPPLAPKGAKKAKATAAKKAAGAKGKVRRAGAAAPPPAAAPTRPRAATQPGAPLPASDAQDSKPAAGGVIASLVGAASNIVEGLKRRLSVGVIAK